MAWERHCFLPEQNRSKIDREPGRQIPLSQNTIFVRLWLTRKAKKIFLPKDVTEKSTNQIRANSRLDQSDRIDFVGEAKPSSNRCASACVHARHECVLILGRPTSSRRTSSVVLSQPILPRFCDLKFACLTPRFSVNFCPILFG